MSDYSSAAEDIDDILLYDKLAEKATTLHECIQGYTCWLESIMDIVLSAYSTDLGLLSRLHVLSNGFQVPCDTYMS